MKYRELGRKSCLTVLGGVRRSLNARSSLMLRAFMGPKTSSVEGLKGGAAQGERHCGRITY